MILPVLAATFICAQPGVVDGDTLTCRGGVRVRLWGIDAPERHEPEGPASTRALSRIVTGRDLSCEPRGKSYNRIVARCFTAGRDVGGEMVRQGFAADWPAFSKGAYR